MFLTKLFLKESDSYQYPLYMVSNNSYSSEDSFQIILATGEIRRNGTIYLQGFNINGVGWKAGCSGEWDFSGFRPLNGTITITQE